MTPRRSEQALHRACAEYLDLVLMPPSWWTTFPAGGGGRIRGAILRGLGLKPGVPDILIVHNGTPYWVELKTRRGRLSPDQIACHAWLAEARCSVALVRSLDELHDCLVQWGIPTREARPFDASADAVGSYYDAIAEIGRRVKGGAPVPTTGYFGHRRSEP